MMVLSDVVLTAAMLLCAVVVVSAVHGVVSATVVAAEECSRENSDAAVSAWSPEAIVANHRQ